MILPLRLGLGALLFTFSLPPFLLVNLLRLLLSLLWYLSFPAALRVHGAISSFSPLHIHFPWKPFPIPSCLLLSLSHPALPPFSTSCCRCCCSCCYVCAVLASKSRRVCLCMCASSLSLLFSLPLPTPPHTHTHYTYPQTHTFLSLRLTKFLIQSTQRILKSYFRCLSPQRKTWNSTLLSLSLPLPPFPSILSLQFSCSFH